MSMVNTKPRNYAAQASIANSAFEVLLDTHPDSFECLVFKAIIGSEENVAQDVTDYAGNLESTSRGIEYADPVVSRAFIIPDDSLRLMSLYDGSEADYMSKDASQPVVLMLKEKDVPLQSVVRWREESSVEGEPPRVITMYVLRSEAMWRSPSTTREKLYCIPFTASSEIDG